MPGAPGGGSSVGVCCQMVSGWHGLRSVLRRRNNRRRISAPTFIGDASIATPRSNIAFETLPNLERTYTHVVPRCERHYFFPPACRHGVPGPGELSPSGKFRRFLSAIAYSRWSAEPKRPDSDVFRHLGKLPAGDVRKHRGAKLLRSRPLRLRPLTILPVRQAISEGPHLAHSCRLWSGRSRSASGRSHPFARPSRKVSYVRNLPVSPMAASRRFGAVGGRKGALVSGAGAAIVRNGVDRGPEGVKARATSSPRSRSRRIARSAKLRRCPAASPNSGRRFVAPDDDVDVERVELDAAADAAGLLAAIRVEPEPRNGSRTMSPRLVRSRSASSSMAVGLTVGWSCKPRRASEPSDEAPG